jgi:uncharacterized membrane protein
MAHDLTAELRDAEKRLLGELRGLRRKLRAQGDGEAQLTLGQKIADTVAANMGSWRFIIIQSVILLFWIILNVTAFIQKWDPYPFILLNLALSFQAAYAAPFIMMSQNRQSDIDRKKAENDYNVNIKAELEIELLHQKVDELREKEMQALTQALADLTQHVKNEGVAVTAAARAASPKITAAKATTPKATAKPAAKPSSPKATSAKAAPKPRAAPSKTRARKP